MKLAVCAIIINDEDKILAVTRRQNPDDIGLPGGKVDEGETSGQAIVREVFEETGLKVFSLREIYKGVCEGETDYLTTCYEAYCLNQEAKSMEDGIDVKWVSKEELIDPKNSFSKYNKKVFEIFFGYTES